MAAEIALQQLLSAVALKLVREKSPTAERHRLTTPAERGEDLIQLRRVFEHLRRPLSAGEDKSGRNRRLPEGRPIP